MTGPVERAEHLWQELTGALARAEHCLDALDASELSSQTSGDGVAAEENRTIRTAQARLSSQAAGQMRRQLAETHARTAEIAERARASRLRVRGARARALLRRSTTTVPEPVARAVEFVQTHADAPVRVADIAAAAGLSERRLLEVFRASLGTTPSGYLQRVRLERAHAELDAADPSRQTVAGIAARWGFRHAGRFARLYREAYGHPPSCTLRNT